MQPTTPRSAARYFIRENQAISNSIIVTLLYHRLKHVTPELAEIL
jgi:hypothetical protein